MPKDTPQWLKKAVIYGVFPRIHSQEGNFEGVIRDLERIRSLGTDLLWILPIHPIGEIGRKGQYGSPYSIKDYRAVNPDYGTEKDFRKLVDKAHELGMKILMDVVYHHTSMDSVLVQEHPEWFLKDQEGNFTRKVPEWSDVYDLDYNQPGFWEYQIETLEKWVDVGVDGFRCDVAPMVPLEFWKKARSVLSRKKEVIWLAESGWMCFVKKDKDLGFIHHTDPELHEAFDITFDADGGEYLQKYFRGQASLKDYLHQVYLQEVLYPRYAVKMRYLESHDDPRIARIIRDKSSLKCWTVFFMLLPGAAYIYGGQEYAITGDNDRHDLSLKAEEQYHNTRFYVDWENGDRDFFDFVQHTIKVMKEIKGTCYTCSAQEITGGVVKIHWTGISGQYIVLVNLENKFGDIPIDFECEGTDLLTGEHRVLSKIYKIEKVPLIIKINR